ncbi:MAG: P-loop NTPase fold protein, partial [Chloroflexota bacterium]
LTTSDTSLGDSGSDKREKAISASALLLAIVAVAQEFQVSQGVSLDDPAPFTFLLKQFDLNRLGAIRTNYFDDMSDQRFDIGQVTAQQAADLISFDLASQVEPIKLSQDVLNILKASRRIAVKTIEGPLIHTRHLLVEALYDKPHDTTNDFQRILHDSGLDIAAVRSAYLAFIEARYPDDEQEAWRMILGVGADRLPQYSADDAQGKNDLLNIDPDVNALAALISTHRITPPLAIGIFGDWGSGKTFFMRRMQRRVNKLSRLARDSHQPQHALSFFKNIVQIEFNAWHYVESNLWASMVEHIFTNLRIADDDKPSLIEKRQQQLLSQLQAAKLFQNATQEEEERTRLIRDAAKEKVEKIKAEQEEALNNLAEKHLTTTAILEQIKIPPGEMGPLTDLARDTNLIEAGQATLDFYGAIQEALAVLSRGNALVTPLVNAKDRGRRFGALILIIIASPLLGFGISFFLSQLTGLEVLEDFASWAGTLVTLLTAGAEWLRRQSAWVSTQITRAEKAKHTLDTLLEEKQAEFDKAISKAQLELDHLEGDYQVALSEQLAAEKRVQDIQAQLAEPTAAQLARFIQERTDTNDYRKHLGLLAMIRRDFETLSNYITNINDKLLDPEQNPAEIEPIDGSEFDYQEGETASDSDASELEAHLPKKDSTNNTNEPDDSDDGINRIILYIDDLDRCPPDKVVQVLQAVHLLLAFPLFVVVVGVDSRWVSYSLTQQYRGLLKTGRTVSNDGLEFRPEATPYDYLEKIFQIPLWLEPVNAAGTRNMLAGLIPEVIHDVTDRDRAIEGIDGDDPKQETRTERWAAERQAGSRTKNLQIDENLSDDKTQDDNSATTKGWSYNTRTSENTHRGLNLNPETLQIRQSELTFMKDLSPILGRSPRAIKRFINVYRLIKVGLDDQQHHTFFDEKDPGISNSQVVMFLLAILTGIPSLSKVFFETIYDQVEKGDGEASEVLTLDQLVAVIQGDTNLPDDAQEDVGKLNDWLQMYTDEALKQIPVNQLLDWAPDVARFSFRAETKIE